MKRGFFWITILLLLLISAGNEENLQISDRAMVHAVGIDQSGEDITVTLQIFKPEGSGGDTPIDTDKANNFVISNTASTFDEAFSLCESQLGSYLFIGHNQVIVIGSGVSLDDPRRLLGSFIQDKDNYLGVDVVLAENTAAEILAVPLTTGAVSAENFSEILKLYRENGKSVVSNILTLLNSLEGNCNAAVLPVVSVRESSAPEIDSASQSQNSSQPSEEEESTGQLLVVSKGAVVSDGKIAGYLTPDQMTGLNWLTDSIKHTTVQCTINGVKTSFTVQSKGVDISLEKSDGRVIFNADITARILTEGMNLTDEYKRIAEQEIKDEIASQCNQLIYLCYTKYGADLLNITCRLAPLDKLA